MRAARTLVAGLRLEGALDRERFHAYIEQALVPSLRPGQIVVLDNLAVHKSARAIAAIVAAGCSVVFLPPTPQTSTRSNWPSARSSRTCALAVRTIETVIAAICPALDAITPAYFTHCGYRFTGQLL